MLLVFVLVGLVLTACAGSPANSGGNTQESTPTDSAGSTPPAGTAEPGKPDVPPVKESFTTGSWKVTLYNGVTDQQKGWYKNLKDPQPANWQKFPNVDNTAVGFKAADGLEYGLDERNHCQVQPCGIVVAAREYLLITADYDLGFVSCTATKDVGCAIAIFNVGDVTASFDDVIIQHGFTLNGRYWNGDTLHVAMWGLMSHVDANMMNMVTSLNPAGINNAGANCSNPKGCTNGVNNKIVVTSGNQILGIAEMTVKP